MCFAHWGLRQTCLEILRKRKSEEQKDLNKAGICLVDFDQIEKTKTSNIGT